MSILKAIILGIVQGATEFLPISSSGHLSIFQHFMGLSGEGSLLLTVLLHIGTLVAVVLVYYKTFWVLIKEMYYTLRDLFKGNFSYKNTTPDRWMLYMMVISCIPLLILIIPIGNDMRVMDFVSSFAEDNDIFLEGVCFLITASLLLFATHKAKKNTNERPMVNTRDAVFVGIAQVFAACLPGVSRSGSTISTGMICGVSKNYMVRYSFVLGTPAILAASLVEIKGAIETNAMQSNEILPAIIGIITAMIVGVAAIKLLEWLVKTDKFKFFAYYCLLMGIAVIIAGIIEVL